jgi:PAS domain S-box-containing protein
MTPKAGQIMWRPLRLLGCGLLLGLLMLDRCPAAQATLEAAPNGELQKPLVIACDRDNPPYTMLYPEGAPAGMFIDIWRLWAKKSGKRIEFRFTDLGESVASIKTGEADIHSGLFATEDRTATMDFSQPFFESSSSLFFPLKYGQVKNIEDLDGERIGAIHGGATAAYLQEHVRSLEVLTYKDPRAMIDAALMGEIRAIASETLGFFMLLGHHGRAGDFNRLDKPLYKQKFVAAVAKGRRDLLAEIEAGFDAISNDELMEIETRWIPVRELLYFRGLSAQVNFTASEKAWLRDHRILRIGSDPALPPFEFIDSDEQYRGIASDYMRLLAERLGFDINIVPSSSWSEVIKLGKSRAVDVYPCAVDTPERRTYMRFTRPYLKFPVVIITEAKTPYLGGLKDLSGLQLAVVRDFASHEFLQRDYPDIQLVPVESPREGLEAVSSNRVYAFVENLGTATYLISKHGFLNLKVAAPTPYDFELALGVRSDWPELFSLMEKGLNSVSLEERNAISRKWLTLKFEHALDPVHYWNLAKVGGGAAIVLALILLWNVQIRRREERFRGLTEHGMDITQAFSEAGAIVYQSPSHASLLGYADNELIGHSVDEVFHEEDLPKWQQTLDTLRQSQEVQRLVHRLRQKNGEYLFFESNIVDMTNNKALRAIVISARDVTDRITAEEELKKAHAQLEQRVAERTTALTDINIELQREIEAHEEAKQKILTYQDLQRSLTSELALAEERERRRIAVDLHDRVSQALALCQMKLGLLQKHALDPEAAKSLAEALELCHTALADTRTLTFEISPPELYELGLEAALDELTEMTGKDHALATEFVDDEELKPLTLDVQVTLYRAVRELIINVVKHARANRIKVAVGREDRSIRVDVADDGIGFDPSKVYAYGVRDKSFGLLSIRERIGLLGGSMEIDSQVGGGTRVHLRAPLKI